MYNEIYNKYFNKNDDFEGVYKFHLYALLRDNIDDREYDDKFIDELWDNYCYVTTTGDITLDNFVDDLGIYLDREEKDITDFNIDDFIHEVFDYE